MSAPTVACWVLSGLAHAASAASASSATLFGWLAFEDLEDVFEFRSRLFNNLVADAHVAFCVVPFQALTSAADRETLLVEQAANLSNHDDVVSLIVTAVCRAASPA